MRVCTKMKPVRSFLPSPTTWIYLIVLILGCWYSVRKGVEAEKLRRKLNPAAQKTAQQADPYAFSRALKERDDEILHRLGPPKSNGMSDPMRRLQEDQLKKQIPLKYKPEPTRYIPPPPKDF